MNNGQLIMTNGQLIILFAASALCAGIGFLFGHGRRIAELLDLETLNKDLPTLILDHERVTRKAGEYLEKIEEVIMERETWRKLYNDQAAGHENAQALMMQTINKLVLTYQRETGKQIRLDPMIELVRGEWVGVHGPDVRKDLGANGKPTQGTEPA